MDIRTALKTKHNEATQQVTNTPVEEIPRVTMAEGASGKVEGDVKIDDETYGGDIAIRDYMRFLEERGITKDDIQSVTETIITTSNLEWSDFVLGGKISVRFKMRSGWVEDIIAKKVDEMANTAGMSINRFTGTIRMLNITASLTHYAGTDYKITNEDEFNTQFKFIESLPYPILVSLGNKLAVFDRVVAVAMSDWALGNFTEPLKENS